MAGTRVPNHLIRDARAVPRELQRDFSRAFEICLDRARDTVRLGLDRAVEVWPGGVLVDLTERRFHDAAGLSDADLQPLREGRPTLAELVDHHGEAWVRCHGLRLCLLGMARLSGVAPD